MEAIAGEAVPPGERAQRVLEAFGGLQMLAGAYGVLLALLWLGTPRSTSLAPVEPQRSRSVHEVGGWPWISASILSLAFLFGEADRQLAFIRYQTRELADLTLVSGTPR